MCVCCVSARTRVYMFVCECVFERERERVCVCVCARAHMVNVKDLPCGVIPGMKLTELIRALPAWRAGERRGQYSHEQMLF